METVGDFVVVFTKLWSEYAKSVGPLDEPDFEAFVAWLYGHKTNDDTSLEEMALK